MMAEQMAEFHVVCPLASSVANELLHVNKKYNIELETPLLMLIIHR